MSCLLCRCLARPSIVLSGFSRGHDIPLLSAGDGVLGGHSTEGISVCIIVSEPMNAPLAVTSVSLDHHAPFTTSKPFACASPATLCGALHSCSPLLVPLPLPPVGALPAQRPTPH